MDGRQLQRQVADMLLDKIKDDQFPSVTMMNRVESVIREDPDELSDYAEMLFEKIKDDRFPSIDMLNRLDRLAGQLR